LDGIPLGNAVLPPEVPLSIVSRDGQLIVIWNVSNATLEEADSVTSSWRDVAGPPCGGYYIPPDPTTNAAKFFRLRYPGP
jgi:cell wall assembly regulator SMI1